MKFIFFIISIVFIFTTVYAENHLKFFIDSALKNNLKLNAERENQKSIKQNINISRSEFLPSISLSGDQSSSQSTGKTDQSGSRLSDSNLDTETKTVSVDQKIFQGFKGFNSYKKSELEVKQADVKLRQAEQQTILDAISAYFDFIFKTKNENFNLSNVNLFARQVESDSARLQKGEITLTDLAQSESSLAGANASLIKSQTELVASMAEFERITGTVAPSNLNINTSISFSMPTNLTDALKLSSKNNPNLSIARINLAISEKELSVEKSKLSPSASLNYSVTENKDLSATIDEDEQETVKATISWPLIKGGKNYSTIKKFKYKKEQNKLLLADKESEVKTQTATSWSFYQSAESVLKSTASQLKAAEIANEGISLEYDSGNSRTTLELIQSRSLLLDARISYAIAEKDLVVSKLELLSQIGGLDLKALNIQ